jgi:futalosine hydrolase
MRVLLITATELEMKALGELPANIDCRVTGVGVPSTIYQLQKALNNQSYDLVIQAGIAGAFSEKFQLGDVVKVKSDYFGELGIRENYEFAPLFKTHLADVSGRFYPDGILVNSCKEYLRVELPAVAAITVNLVTDDSEHNNSVQNTFSADIESMEGAGLHFVCSMEKIDFLQIRAISNRVGERDKSRWQIEQALENLGVQLRRILSIGPE